jgi:hypothetical protein
MTNRTAIENQCWHGPLEIQAKVRGNKKLRHPERSEANDFVLPWRLIRAQSKDPANFTGGNRDRFRGMRGQSRPANAAQELFWGGTSRSSSRRRSFDYGSAQFSGQTPLPLAFAQDDGAFYFTHFRSGVNLLSGPPN